MELLPAHALHLTPVGHKPAQLWPICHSSSGISTPLSVSPGNASGVVHMSQSPGKPKTNLSSCNATSCTGHSTLWYNAHGSAGAAFCPRPVSHSHSHWTTTVAAAPACHQQRLPATCHPQLYSHPPLSCSHYPLCCPLLISHIPTQHAMSTCTSTLPPCISTCCCCSPTGPLLPGCASLLLGLARCCLVERLGLVLLEPLLLRLCHLGLGLDVVLGHSLGLDLLHLQAGSREAAGRQRSERAALMAWSALALAPQATDPNGILLSTKAGMPAAYNSTHASRA
jgi:hypothetical protein